MDEIRGKIINVFDAWERGGFKGDSGIMDTFFSQKNEKNKLNPKLSNQFEPLKEELNNSSQNAKALAEQMKSVDNGITGYAKTCKNGEITTKGFQEAMNNMSSSTKVSEIALQTLSTVGNTLVEWGISKVISGLYEFSQVSKNVAERALELGNSFNNTKSNIEDYKFKISELYDIINDENSSTDDVSNARKSLLSLQDEMINKYGTEKKVIDDVKGAINGQTESLTRLTNAKWQNTKKEFNDGNFWNDIANFFEGTDNISRMLNEYGEETILFNWVDFANLNKLTDGMVAELENIGIDIKVDTDNLQGIRDFDSLVESISDTKGAKLAITGNAEEIYNQLSALLNLIGNDNSLDKLYDKVESTANKYKDLKDTYKDFYNQYILYEKILTDNSDYADTFKSLTDAYEIYKDAFISGDENKINEATKNYADILTIATSTAIANNDSDVATYFENMYPELQSVVSGWKFNTAFDANTDGLQDKVQSVLEKLKVKNGQSLTTEKILGLNSESEQYQSLVSIANSYNMTLEEMVELLKKRNLISEIQKPEDNADKEEFPTFKEAWENLNTVNNETLKNSKNQLLDLANSGQLSAKKLSEIDGAEKYFENIGLSAQEASNKINELVTSSSQLSSMRSGITSITGALGQKISDGLVSTDTLSSFDATIQGLDSWQEFEEVMGNNKSSMEEAQEVANKLATEYVNNANFLSHLTEAKKDYYVSQLEEMGVTNALEVVNANLVNSENMLSVAQSEVAKYSNALTDSKERNRIASINLANSSVADIQALYNEANAAGFATNGLMQLLAHKYNVNNLSIATAADCSNLAKLYSWSSSTATALNNLAKVKAAISSGKYVPEEELKGRTKYAQNQIEEANKTNINTQINVGGATPNTGVKGNNTAASQSKTTINWIERKLERLQKVIDATKAKFDNLFTVNKKTSNLNTQIKQTKSLLKANEKAAKSYKKYANNIKLSDSLKKKVRDGNYNIKDYDSKTADQINKYKDYYDKYKEAQKQVDELTAQIRELKEKKYQIYIDDATANIDKLNALSDISTTYEEKNKYLEDQKSYLKKSYDYQIKIAELTKDETKKAQLQAEYEKELIELKNQKFENIQTYYESEIKLLDHQFTSLDNKISEAETAGKKVSQSYYEEQKKINEEKKKQYEEEKAKLEEQITDIPQGTKEWYDAKDAIQECANSISDCAKETYELNNAINQLYFDIFDDISESIDRIITEQEFLQDLFAHEKLTDDKTGYFTDAGLAKLGSLSASYYASKEKANNAEELLKELQNVKANGRQPDGTYKLPDDTDKLGDWTFNSLDDLQEKINETYTEWQNDIKDTYSLESAIADLMKEQYQSELDMLQELIDAKKEALQTEKDLHDYKQSIQEKTNNISTIQKQIAAYQGDTSQEGLAKLQKLQVQLSEKEKELEETEYDRYISDQENMLDKLYTEYEELVTKKLEDFMTLVREGLDTANQKTAVISEYLSKVAGDNGYKIETDGLFDTVNGSISDSTSKIVAAIENQINGNTASDSNPGKTESDAPFLHTGYHPLPSIELKEPQLSSLDIKKAFSKSKPVIALKSYESMTKDDVVNFIKKYGTAPDPKKKDYGKVNTAFKDEYSKVLSKEKMKELAKALDVTYDSDKIYSRLKSLNVPGFKKGGIVSVDNIKKQVHDNGDKVLMSANPGEGILTPNQTAQFETLVNKLPQLNFTVDAMNNLDKIPNPTNLVPVGNTTMGDMVFNIDMPNVTNPDEFIKTIQTNQKMQKALRLVTTDRIAGNGKLNVNKII